MLLDPYRYAASTAYVFHVKLRPEILGQFLCDEAGEHVGRTTRRERNDHAHGSRGIGLRRCYRRCNETSDTSSCKQQKSTAKDFHGVPRVLGLAVNVNTRARPLQSIF